MHCKIKPTKRKGWNIPPFINSTVNGYDCVKQIKEKMYNHVECIIIETREKRHKINRVKYSTLKDMLRSLYYQKITINVCQFVYIMTGVKLKKQRQEYSTALYWLKKNRYHKPKQTNGVEYSTLLDMYRSLSYKVTTIC